MRPTWPPLLSTGARWIQRVLIVLFALLPLLVVTVASVPALVLLPFLPAHSARGRAIVQQLIAWTRTTLVASRNR